MPRTAISSPGTHPAALSSVFPDGEDYFVRSVRHYRDRISDPALKRQVAGSSGKRRCTGGSTGSSTTGWPSSDIPPSSYERFTRRACASASASSRPISNLAATAALEHFTATLAELVLTKQEIRDLMGADAVRDLFVWHALEESEHKAVAFDVYKAVGGGERLRVWTMNFFRFGFVIGMGLAVIISLLGDRATYRRGNLRGSWRRLRDRRSWTRPCGPSSRTTTARTSTPTSATRPNWWKPGEPRSSVSTAP